jgi:hypothetical protein
VTAKGKSGDSADLEKTVNSYWRASDADLNRGREQIEYLRSYWRSPSGIELGVWRPLEKDEPLEEHLVAAQEIAAIDRWKTWVEVKIVDGEDKPVVAERCQITFPDGTIKYESTNADGIIRVSDIDNAGDCSIEFVYSKHTDFEKA